MGEQDPVYAVGLWSVRPGNEQAFIAAWKDFAAWTSTHMKGAIYGKLLQDIENPARFVSFGPWEDIESVLDWRQQPEFKKAFARFMELCDEIAPGTFHLVAEIAR